MYTYLPHSVFLFLASFFFFFECLIVRVSCPPTPLTRLLKKPDFYKNAVRLVRKRQAVAINRVEIPEEVDGVVLGVDTMAKILHVLIHPVFFYLFVFCFVFRVFLSWRICTPSTDIVNHFPHHSLLSLFFISLPRSRLRTTMASIALFGSVSWLLCSG